MFFTLNSSCSSVIADYTTRETHKEFKPYIQDFKYMIEGSRYEYKLKTNKIVFTTFPKDKNGKWNTIGKCYGMFQDNTIIYIDKEYWKYASPTSKAFTIYHELGHCICNNFHTEVSTGFIGFFEDIVFKLGLAEKKGYLWDGCPASLMHPSEFDEFCMLKHYMYYIDELTTSCK